MTNLVDYAKSANHCQRIWADVPVEDKIIEELIGVAINMPTKQNEEYYSLLVSSDQDFNHLVYLHTYSPGHSSVMDLSFKHRHLTNYNTQLRAPLQFHWLVDLNQKYKYGNFNPDGYLAIGISAGAVALSANQLGLKTGFCSCIDQDLMKNVINENFNTTHNHIIVSLGIGYPEIGYPHNTVRRPYGGLYKKETFIKNIKVFKK